VLAKNQFKVRALNGLILLLSFIFIIDSVYSYTPSSRNRNYQQQQAAQQRAAQIRAAQIRAAQIRAMQRQRALQRQRMARQMRQRMQRRIQQRRMQQRMRQQMLQRMQQQRRLRQQQQRIITQRQQKIRNNSLTNRVVKAPKTFTTLKAAKKWVSVALLLFARTVKNLSLSSINKLGTLSKRALLKLRKFSPVLKRTILGCASPCKVDIDVVKKYLNTMTVTARKAKTLTKINEVLAALPAGINQKIIKQKLKKHKQLMIAITKSGISKKDLAVIGKFLTKADKANAVTAYRTFVRTLTVLAPARIGPDIQKFNKVSEALVIAEPRMGAALKGSMFETFAKLHLGRFKNFRFGRVTFKKANGLAKRRTADGYIESSKILWDFKHYSSKVPLDQARDYRKIREGTFKSTEGKTVDKVYYLFQNEKIAKLNKHLLKLGFEIYFVKPPDIVSILE